MYRTFIADYIAIIRDLSQNTQSLGFLISVTEMTHFFLLLDKIYQQNSGALIVSDIFMRSFEIMTLELSQYEPKSWYHRVGNSLNNDKEKFLTFRTYR